MLRMGYIFLHHFVDRELLEPRVVQDILHIVLAAQPLGGVSVQELCDEVLGFL